MSEQQEIQQIAEQRMNNALSKPLQVRSGNLPLSDFSDSVVPNQDSITAAQSDND